MCYNKILKFLVIDSGRDNSVGVATRFDLDGPGIESRWGRDFPHLSRPALGAHPAPYTGGPGLFPGRGVALNTHPIKLRD